MQRTYGAHFDNGSSQEFDAVILREDADLAHAVVLVNGKTVRL
jgi:hypothetical protein